MTQYCLKVIVFIFPFGKCIECILGETLRVEVAKEQGVLGVRIAGGSDKP